MLTRVLARAAATLAGCALAAGAILATPSSGEQLHEFAVGGPWRVDVYAEPLHMEWDMGDGSDPVQCPPGSPGVAWNTELDHLNPPAEACTHVYL